MREIKFRANRFGTVFEVLEYSFSGVAGKQDILLGKDGKECLREWSKNLDLMQYTGLKDKNGKEIYEGDIVKTTWFVDPPENNYVENISVIRWSDGHSNERVHAGFWTEFIRNGDFSGYFKHPLGHVSGSTHLNEREQGFYKAVIIGNIYENPELLKEEIKK